MFNQFYDALDEYKKIAHGDVECGKPYALRPEEASPEVNLCWPDDEWPFSKRAGVYVIFSADETILYVGRAWHIGRRLADHFCEDRNGACVSPRLYQWSKPPIYVIVIAVPPEKRFEAACLEEYLIEKFKPIDNTMGVRSRQRTSRAAPSGTGNDV